jgi:hypothetical protein
MLIETNIDSSITTIALRQTQELPVKFPKTWKPHQPEYMSQTWTLKFYRMMSRLLFDRDQEPLEYDYDRDQGNLSTTTEPASIETRSHLSTTTIETKVT